MFRSFAQTSTSSCSGISRSHSPLFDVSFYSTFISAAVVLEQAFASFVQYCLNGKNDQFTQAVQHLDGSCRNLVKSGDTTFATITSEMRSVLDFFWERSTWTNIQRHAPSLLSSNVWQVYLRNLAYEKSVVEFWPSQLHALQEDILMSDDSYIVQMPTSAGKTFIAELAILSALTRFEDARCLYIAPYRALVNEIESSLGQTIGAIGYRVSTLMGGFEFDSFQDYLATKSDVLIATPEKTELLLRTHPEFFRNVSVIIIDEGHIIDEGVPDSTELDEDQTLLDKLGEEGTLGRGVLLELLIVRLKRRLSNARFIFLSAVMPEINAHDFVSWLCHTREEPLRIDASLRPSRQVRSTFEWETVSVPGKKRPQYHGRLEYISLPKLPFGGSYPYVPKFLTVQKLKTGEKTPTARDAHVGWPSPHSKTQTTAALAIKFAATGPVIVFCAAPSHVENVIENIEKALGYMENTGLPAPAGLEYEPNPDLESYVLAIEWLGEEHPLTRALRYKVALHYGPLPDPVRQAVEDDYKNNRIRILVSTNTLGQGVNLPVKTAIIYSLWFKKGINVGKHTEDSSVNPPEQETRDIKVKMRDFWNICGRAGRAGKETEGQIVFVINSTTDRQLKEEYIQQENLEEFNSALYKLLQALIERRISEDDLIGYLDSHVLSILAEEIVDSQDEQAVAEFLKASLETYKPLEMKWTSPR
jgi:helicase